MHLERSSSSQPTPVHAVQRAASSLHPRRGLSSPRPRAPNERPLDTRHPPVHAQHVAQHAIPARPEHGHTSSKSRWSPRDLCHSRPLQ
eukprot:1519782-Prymnesium_polylepis.1